MVGKSSDRLIRSYVQGVIDGRKATKNGKGSERVIQLGKAGTWDECGGDIEEAGSELTLLVFVGIFFNLLFEKSFTPNACNT